jgi:hypothetical protein
VAPRLAPPMMRYRRTANARGHCDRAVPAIGAAR